MIRVQAARIRGNTDEKSHVKGQRLPSRFARVQVCKWQVAGGLRNVTCHLQLATCTPCGQVGAGSRFRIPYFVFRSPYCVLRGDWTEYAVRTTHHSRAVARYTRKPGNQGNRAGSLPHPVYWATGFPVYPIYFQNSRYPMIFNFAKEANSFLTPLPGKATMISSSFRLGMAAMTVPSPNWGWRTFWPDL